MTEETPTSKAYDSPLRLLIIIAASVFITEACVMILLFILPPMPQFVAAPLDALLVTLLVYPVLYRYVVRPMNRQINERRQVEAALRRAQDELESRVNERTAELAQANESLQVEIAERQRAGEELKVALEQVQHRQAEMAGLLAGARAVLEYRDFAGMAQPIFEACRSTIGAMAGYVALPTDDQAHEKPVFLSSGEQASALDVFLPMPIVGLSQQAYVTGKTVYTNDPGYYEYAQRLPDGHLPLNNVLFAPMKIRGFVVGTLALANKPDGFSDDDARLAAAFAELAAIAVLNSQTIELLEGSERRFRTLAQATFEGIVISEGGIIREANEQFARMHGYKLTQVLGKPISDFLPPQDYERLRQAIAGEGRHVGEYHALRKDGSVFLLEVRAYSTEQSGRVVRVAALRDITERKQAEDAIRARNALLASIIESPDSAIFSIDREYRYTSFNRRHAHVMKALFGADIEIGRNLLDYHTVVGDRQSAKQYLDRALSGESFVIEDWAGEDALTRRCFEIAHSPVKDANHIIGASVIAQDITERKYADQVLRENEEWLRMAFDAGDLGRWRYSVATGMLHLDERARIHSGSHHNTVSQMEALERVHPDDRALLEQEMTDALNPAGHGRYAAEYRVIWSNGETHWLAVQVRVHFEGEGEARQPVLAVGISQDITARKQTEDRVTWLASFPELNPNPVVEVDLSGYIHYLNPTAKRLLPDLESKARAHPWLADWEFLLQKLQTDQTTVHAREVVLGDRVYQQTFYYVPDAQRLRIYALDVTARKRAEEALRESEEKYRLLFENLSDGFALYELVRDAECKPVDWWILEVNQAYSKHTGIDRSRVVGKRISELFPAAISEYLPRFTHVVDEQAPINFETFAQAVDRFQHVTTFPAGGNRFASIIEDITDRKRAEEQLRLLSTALETTVNGVVITDREGQILWVNAAFTSLTGYDREEAVRQNPRVLKSGHHHVEFYRKMWEKILGGDPWSGEIINRRKDGTLYYEEMTITPVRAGGNDITHFVAIKEDISARKEAEESLRRQAALIDLSPDAIIVRQLDGIITFWSQGAETLYGWKELEALGRTVSDLLQAQLPQPLESIAEQLKRTGRWTGEIIHHTRSGLQVIVQSWWLAQFNAQGDITEIFESNVDFTVRKQMEEQLRRTQVLLERRVVERTAELATANNALRLQSTALQAAANGIVITDRKGNIQWANPALTEMTGYSAEEVLGQSTRLFKSGLKEPIFYQHLWNTILSGHVWRGELINRRKDGSLYVEEQTIAPVLNEYGEIANFVAVKQDVTERREAQSRLEQNNRDLRALSEAEHDQRQLAETLAEANLALTKSLDLETVLETVLDCVERLIPYDSANVMLLEAESRLTVRIVRGYERWSSSEQVRAIVFDIQDNPIFNEIVTTCQSRLVSDTRTQPGWESPPGVEQVRSWLGVPLVAGGNVIGLYSLDKTEPGFFTPEHIRKAEMLAGQAAVAVQNAWLFEQVRAGRERLQTLSRRLVESQEAERQYIARELHDEAGQALTSLLFGLGQLEQQIDSSGQADQIAELRQTTNDIIDSLHRLAMDLRPASLDHLGLVPALHQHVRVIGDRYGLIARFKAVGLEDERLPADVETALYRIVQEALTNIIRHARATHIDVLLERRGDRIVVVVEDDGCGFDVEITRLTQDGHLGLAGIQERARTLGGSLIIESTAGIGTTLVVEVPYGNSHPDR